MCVRLCRGSEEFPPPYSLFIIELSLDVDPGYVSRDA